MRMNGDGRMSVDKRWWMEPEGQNKEGRRMEWRWMLDGMTTDIGQNRNRMKPERNGLRLRQTTTAMALQSDLRPRALWRQRAEKKKEIFFFLLHVFVFF